MATAQRHDPTPSAGIYSTFLLANLYEVGVLGINFGLVWGCSARNAMLPLFASNMSGRHLDCGVGTGYFLANALKDAEPSQRNTINITLLDLDPICLNMATKAIHDRTPQAHVECYVADIRSPIPAPLEESIFDSISMFNLFQCVPGGRGKFNAIRVYKTLLSNDGVLTGCTILGAKHATGWFAPMYLRFYNHLGILSNLEDTEDDVVAVLKAEFEEVETWVKGMVLLFRAKGPKH
ncbi:methyltransferase domain-containing protein [Xylariaceae sp. FL0255]|nr:methyltransferase domain-containing protein [Xylariaceae sp. FL0255]